MSLRNVFCDTHFFLYFFCFSKNLGKNVASCHWHSKEVSQQLGNTMAIISAHTPGPHMWVSAGPTATVPPRPYFKCSTTEEVRG